MSHGFKKSHKWLRCASACRITAHTRRENKQKSTAITWPSKPKVTCALSQREPRKNATPTLEEVESESEKKVCTENVLHFSLIQHQSLHWSLQKSPFGDIFYLCPVQLARLHFYFLMTFERVPDTSNIEWGFPWHSFELMSCTSFPACRNKMILVLAVL